MITPPLPDNEDARLRALDALKILDTPPEERFDRLTRLVAQFFDAPMSLVTLLDAERQWFKSEHGLGIRDLPREISFCGYAILERDVMVVPDATKDERFVDNPVVGGPHGIYFYAGCPIFSLDGHALGTICVLDNKPREISTQLLESLKDWARVVEQEVCNAEVALLNEQLRTREAQTRQILVQCQDAFISMTGDGRITEWNPKAEAIFGWPRQEVIGQLLVELVIPEQHRGDLLERLETHVKSDQIANANGRLELLALRRNGEQFPVEVTLGLVETNQEMLFTAFLNDISQRKHYENRLQKQALQDELTGLPNRAFLFNRMATAVEESQRQGHTIALLFLDLDGFKQINDTFGHAAGDQLLVQFAHRMKAQVRQSDTVARLAGDEFVILLEQLPEDSVVARGIAEKVIGAMAKPFLINGDCIQAGTSIGIAVAEGNDTAPDDLLRMADTAMYAAKKSGPNQFRLWGG